MIYVVSGYMRSGTSMMMEALKAGGMDIYYSQRHEDMMLSRHSDPSLPYTANAHFYEPSREDMKRQDFINAFDGKVIKVLSPYLPYLPIGAYKIVYMNRNLSSIFRSYLAAIHTRGMDDSPEDFAKNIQRIKDIVKDRRSTKDFVEVNYEDVLKTPVNVFRSLLLCGWHLDVEAAAKVPDMNKRRH